MPLVKLITPQTTASNRPSGLDHSFGMLVELESGEEIALRRGRGILFARGLREAEHDVRLPRGLIDASICSTPDGGFAVITVRVDPTTGSSDALVLTHYAPGRSFRSAEFEHVVAADAHAPAVSANGTGFTIDWREQAKICRVVVDSDLRAAKPSGVITANAPATPAEQSARVSAAVADDLIAQLGDVAINTRDARTVSFGRVPGRADPAIAKWGGRWLFIATDEHLAQHRDESGLLLRAADSIEELPNAADHLILSHDSRLQGCFWAPELHVIGGRLWCLFAPSVGTTEWDGVQAWAMHLPAGADPTDAASWSEPTPVLSASGEPLQLSADRPGISLDMTYFEVRGKSYLAWSQRFTTPFLGDAEIWIAETSAADPTRLISDAVRIVVPEYSWEIDEANVVEAPFAVVRDDTVYMTYSASAVGPTYAVGLVTAAEGADLLDPRSWSKTPYPLLDADPNRGEWGPGHSMFVDVGDDSYLLAYHALGSEDERARESRLRRVLFGPSGRLVLDAEDSSEVGIECPQ